MSRAPTTKESGKSARNSTVLALLTVLLWSTVASAFKIGLRYATVTQLVATSTFFSTVALALVLLVRGRLRQSLESLGRDWPRALLQGALNPLLYYPVLFLAYHRLPAQVAQPLNYTWTIALSLLAVPLLGHRLNRRDVGALLMGYGGVVVVSQSADRIAGSTDLTGIALALSSAFIWALYWILKTKDDRPKISALFQNFLLAFPLTCGLSLLVDGVPRVSAGAGASLLAGLYIGMFEMGLSFVLFQYALALSPNISRTSQLIFLCPFISLLFIHVVLGEPIMIGSVVGLTLVVASFWIGRAPPPESSEQNGKKRLTAR